MSEHDTDNWAIAMEAELDRLSGKLAAYEARIAELEYELARVKAESLRVVKVGEPCTITQISICACFLHLGVLYRLYSFSNEEFGAWQISDHTEHLFSLDTIVQPVRLERWERPAKNNPDTRQ